MAFSNPVVGGTALIRPAIRSPNYVPGTTGWSINKDGSAEFGDATIRGNVVVVTPGGNSIDIVSAGGNSLIRFWNIAHTDYALIQEYDVGGAPELIIQSGHRPSIIGPGFPTVVNAIRQDDVGVEIGPYREDTAIFCGSSIFAGDDGIAMSTIESDGDIQLSLSVLPGEIRFLRGSDSKTISYQESSGFLEDSASGWTALGLQNGWNNRVGWNDLEYTRRPDGWVSLRGSISGGTSVNGTRITNVPAGFRPYGGIEGDAVCPIASDTNSPAASGSARLQIQAGGDCFIYGTGAGPLYFDGISFKSFFS